MVVLSVLLGMYCEKCLCVCVTATACPFPSLQTMSPGGVSIGH